MNKNHLILQMGYDMAVEIGWRRANATQALGIGKAIKPGMNVRFGAKNPNRRRCRSISASGAQLSITPLDYFADSMSVSRTAIALHAASQFSALMFVMLASRPGLTFSGVAYQGESGTGAILNFRASMASCRSST